MHMTETGSADMERVNERLKQAILRWTPGIGKQETTIENLYLSRHVTVTGCDNCFYQPSIGIIAQGFKRSIIGSEEYRYGEYHYLVTGVDIPGLTHLTQASEEKPFLAISITLDKSLIAQLSAEIPMTHGFEDTCKGFAISKVDYGLLDSFLRLAELLDNSTQAAVLTPMVIREIHSRLLMSPNGNFLRRINTVGTQSNQIARAISWLRENYRENVQIEALAGMANMALSTFHRHFRQITTLSPVQFQKKLRLYEAQRLMFSGNTDANSAALSVGYESVSQFNREYKRLFGDPPRRNVKRLVETKTRN